nr:metal ABC transporter ATP-binding protein [Cellulosilyticum ruminicola]
MSCKGLSLGYDGKKIASHINFEINKGDYLCIVGENGAGKSTLIKTLLHLQDAIEGEIITGDGFKAYEMGYLPQQTMVQKDFPATVWEVVLSGNIAHMGKKPFYGKKEKQLAEEKLKELGMWEFRKKCYRNLSGGQQQRTLLARALCATTKIILLDEPVTGLDPKVTAAFYELINKLNKNGITVIMVSHDLQALSYASHILHITRDESFFGTKKQYMKQEIAKQFLSLGGEKKWQIL